MAASIRPWRKTIRWPLMLAVSGSLLCVLLAAGLGMYTFIATTEQSSWAARQADHTRQASEQIQSFVQSEQAQLALIGLLDRGQPGNPSDAWLRFLQENPAWLEIVRLDGSGKPLNDVSTGQPALQNSAATRQAIWFQQARNGKPYIGNAGAYAGETPSLILAVPSTYGEVLAGRLRVNVLWNELARIHFGDTGIAYIIDREDGRMIAYPEPQDLIADRTTEGRQVSDALLTQAENQWQGSDTNPQGIRVQTQVRQIPDTSWTIVTEIDQREVTQARRLALQFLAGGVVLLWLLLTFVMHAYLNRLVLPQVEGLLDKARDRALLDRQFRSDLLARVSHDLRQPLGVILGFSEMIRDEIFGVVNNSQRRAVGEIISSTARLSQMVSDLLDSARLEAHSLHLRVDDFSPDLLLRQASGQVSLLAELKQLELITELDPRLPEKLRGDPTRLLQILNHLAGNAVKFTQRGSVRIRADLVDAEHWSLSVADSGPGIPRDALEFIFEPFFQGNDQTIRDKGGVGLGLAIVQQLVHLMGGCIRVESTVGVGSTFLVTLPFDCNTQKEISCGTN